MDKFKMLSLVIVFFICFQFLSSKEIIRFDVSDGLTGKPIKPDSIVIINNTTDSRYRIKADSVDLDLLMTDVNQDFNQEYTGNFAKIISQNPFKQNIDFSVQTIQSTELSVMLFDLVGQSLFKDRIYLESGIASLRLNLNNLEGGFYFLFLKDNFHEQSFKLFKTEKHSGDEIKLFRLNQIFQKNEQNYSKNGSNQIQSSDVFSFYCYKKGYQTLGKANVSPQDRYAINQLINFAMQQVGSKNYSFGSYEISGLNYKFKNRIWEAYDYGGSKDTTIISDSTILRKGIFQNNSLPMPDFYYTWKNSEFLPCPNFSNDTLILNFCDKSIYSINDGSDNQYCLSTISKVFFNSNQNLLDSVKITIFIKVFLISKTGQDERHQATIAYNIGFYNLMYSIDSKNVLLVELNGKSVGNNVTFDYSLNDDYGFGWNNIGHHDETVLQLISVDDNAFIKLKLTP